MSRSAWFWLMALMLAAVALVVFGSRDFGASSSTLSRDAGGWLAARLYLEARGTEVHIRDQPLDEALPDGVLVLAFPWQQPVTEEEIRAVGDHLRAGHDVVVAYSGEVMEFRETRMFEALSLEASEVRSAPPLNPVRWWSYHRESWLLEPEDESAPAVRVAAFRRAPEAPEGAEVFYRDGDGRPLIFAYTLHRGRVMVLPAGVLANAWLAGDGNADLLESLRLWLGSGWIFDEYHHGLVASTAAAASPTKFAWDLFIAHLALIYVLGVIRLSWRFGPVWRERPPAAGSTAAFLRQLGALHHKLGHHDRAAELLVERARALDPELPYTDVPDQVGGGKKQFLETARRISRAQRRIDP